MTMTDERLAELDAVMAKLSEPRPTKIEHKYTISDWCGRIEYAKYALADAYPDLRAMIDAQAATIARLTGAAKSLLALCEQAGLADDLLAAVFPDSKNRSGQTRDETAKQARRTMNEARAALAKIGANQ